MSTRNDANCVRQEVGEEEDELLKNVATTIVQQPQNEFFSNIKKVSGKPTTAAKTYFARISYAGGEACKKNIRKSSTKNSDSKNSNMESSHSLQLLEDFSKKKQERDQEIMEIQEMLNKIKSPRKCDEQDSPKTHSAEDSPKQQDSNLTKDNNNENEAKEQKSRTEENKVPHYGRSKTEFLLNLSQAESVNYRLTRRDTGRPCSASDISRKPRSKSSQLPLSAKDALANKKIGYNPDEARRYMAMQRKQRKIDSFKDSNIKTKIEKEEIKKRLEDLKKNTRKLISKNIQKKEKFLSKNVTSKEVEVKSLTTPKPQEQKKLNELRGFTSDLLSNTQRNNARGRITSKSSRRDSNSKEYTMPEITLRSSRSLNSVLKTTHSPLLENHKRIGLLRKPENDKDFSFTSHKKYNFDKENQNMEMLTKQLLNTQENKTNRDKNNTPVIELQDQLAANSEKHKDIEANSKEDAVESKQCSLESRNLKAANNEKKETFNKSESTEKVAFKPHELPYWLKPSSAQVYPYNFIMAVRRKLEAIAQPIITSKPVGDRQNQGTSTTSLDSQLNQKKRKSLDVLEEKESKKIKSKQDEIESKEDVERSLKELNLMKESALKQLKPLPQHIKIDECDSREKGNQQSVQENDAISASQFKHSGKFKQTMDFHDAKNNEKIKQNPLQNLCSTHRENYKQHSLQSKLHANYKSMESLDSEINSNLSSISLQIPISNTLTEVSSLRTESGRSYTNSMKQLPIQSEDEVTSLSMQNVSSPEKKLPKTEKEFEFVKPRPVSPLSLEQVDKLKIKRKEYNTAASEDGEMNFTQLLEDFNRSLSQVIQVNEQLKCTLDKSQQILSPSSTKKSSETDIRYSSDFEKSSVSKENDRLKESLQKNTENLKQRKNQIFKMAEEIKPLLMPQTLEQVVDNESSSSNKEKPLFGDLNTKSLTNSLAAAENANQHKIEGEQISFSYDGGEKLKGALDKTILESKKEKEKKEVREDRDKVKQKRNESKTETESLKDNSHKRTEPILLSENERKTVIINGNTFLKIPGEINTRNDDSKHCSSEHRPFNKEYQNQYGNLFKQKTIENVEFAFSEHGLQSQALNSNKLLQENVDINEYDQTQQNRLYKKSHELMDYSSFNSNSNSNNDSSRTHTAKTVPNKAIASKSTIRRYMQKGSDSETASCNSEQCEADSTAQTKESTKSKSISQNRQTDDAISSSIAEVLQKTYESGSYENEDMPQTKTAKYLTEHNDSVNFIESRINRSRGDFKEYISKADKFNETQFQQAIQATASQNSCSELAQSADDEITSSASSKPYLKTYLNPLTNNNEPSGDLMCKQRLSTTSPLKTNRRNSIGSEIVKFFSQYDVERAERQADINDSVSESSLNYSNVGLYDKLIQNETKKSQHLTALLKMREKALLDRTKGQIAWLEVQKVRYKAKGLINHIAAIKKKQRGIILKMEKEREEIKRLLYTTNNKATEASILSTEGNRTNSQQNSLIKHKKERFLSPTPPLTKPKIFSQQPTGKIENALNASPILRANYDLESSRAVEELLKKRENDLRRRREHVERLMKWHQRLDEEEAEVLNLERKLLRYNNVPHMVEHQHSKLPTTAKKLTPASSAISTTAYDQSNTSSIKTTEKKRAARARKMEKRLKEIDKSLRELSNISASSTTSAVMGQNNNEKDYASSVATEELDFVRTTGLKLNKLWKRLTSQQIEKFEATRRYKLCKNDLERLYEEAKMAVLRDFAEDEDRMAKELLEKSASNLSLYVSSIGQTDLPATTSDSKIIEVPLLNLNFSSGHSEVEEESANNSQANATQQGNYSPSVAEQNFKAQALLNSSASSETTSEHRTSEEGKETNRLENNVQMFLALSQRIQASGRQLQSLSGRQISEGPAAGRLRRSLSDTEISDVPKFKADKTTTSQNNRATITSHSNSSNITDNRSARSFVASEQHQRSKSSIVEMTYIPSTHVNYTDFSHTPTHHSNIHQEYKQNEPQKDFEKVNHHPTSRSSVICSVGAVTPLKSSQQTSSDIATITEDSNSSTTLANKSISKVSTTSQSLKQKLSYSDQIGLDSEIKVKEISSKLDEITAAVTQLSQMNALPSYESVTHSHSKYKTIDVGVVNTNDESNLSTDASSYSFNFDNITTDKHSSPGTSVPYTNTSPFESATSKTYTKEDDREHCAAKKSALRTHSCASTSLNSTRSNTFTKEVFKTSSQTVTQSMLENRILDTYEDDFESDLSNVTRIDDITIPTFETTVESSQDEDGDELTSASMAKQENVVTSRLENEKTKISNKTYDAEELQKSLSPFSSEKSSSASDFKSHISYSPDTELLPPPPSLPPPPPAPSSTPSAATAISSTTSSAAIATASNQSGSNHLMPDIINELELRRHQLILDNEHLKQYEHIATVPYMYVREIPNKPPPPYVPPAHGSPMTTIFPSEDRIKDITFRRTHELYCELLKTEYCNEKGEKLPFVMEEQITNIYERIILDICREYLEEHGEILRDGDPTNFHSQLAFFNPPNRLRCIQDAIYKEVRTCLAMDKIQPKRTQIYSVYGQRAKQDHIGKIIIQEMYDEDDRWCNFHREESEVLHLILEEMNNKYIAVIAKEVLLDEGGVITENEEQVVEQGIPTEGENVACVVVEKTSQIGQQCINEEQAQQESQSETSSVLVETINDENETYCVNKSKEDSSLLNQTTITKSDNQESANVNNTNISTTANAVHVS